MWGKCYEGMECKQLIHPGRITERVGLWVGLEGQKRRFPWEIREGWSFLRKRTLAEVAWIGDSHRVGGREPRTHGGTVRGWWGHIVEEIWLQNDISNQSYAYCKILKTLPNCLKWNGKVLVLLPLQAPNSTLERPMTDNIFCEFIPRLSMHL